jgi:hypothetical protein
MKVPRVWRVVNAVRRYLEDRAVPEGQYLQQMCAVYHVKLAGKE